MKIKYLTFECVSRCNMDCKFCFSYWRDKTAELGTEKAKKAISLLKKQGLEAISFTGGEPLLRDDLPELLAYSKSIGLKVILTTNGILLKNKLAEIARDLDFVGLPLDSDDAETHNGMRITKATENHHALVLDLIGRMQEAYPWMGVKINTVVTKQNKDSVSGVGKLIEGKAISWKLSHFIPGAYGGEHKGLFEISKEDYLRVAKNSMQKHPKMNIIVSAAYTRDAGCRILSQEGHLLKSTNAQLVDLGSVFDLDNEQIYEGFNEKENTFFFEKTYPAKGVR